MACATKNVKYQFDILLIENKLFYCLHYFKFKCTFGQFYEQSHDFQVTAISATFLIHLKRNEKHYKIFMESKKSPDLKLSKI